MESVRQADLDHLAAALDGVKGVLLAHLDGGPAARQPPGEPDPRREAREPPAASMGDPDAPALERLCKRFGLTGFERGLLLLCAGAHLDAGFSSLCARIQGAPEHTLPTFDLALRVFNHGYWFPFSARSTLRFWRLVDLEDPSLPNLSPLRIAEPVLGLISGDAAGDPALEPLLHEVRDEGPLLPSHDALARQIRDVLERAVGDPAPPLIQLTGTGHEARRAVARRAIGELGRGLFSLDPRFLPREAEALHELFRSLERDAILTGCGYLFDAGDGLHEEPAATRPLTYLLQRLTAPCLVVADGPLGVIDRRVVKIEVRRPTWDEQKNLWDAELDGIGHGSDLRDQVRELLDQFDLSPSEIRNVCTDWQACLVPAPEAAAPGSEDPLTTLKRHCRRQSSRQTDGLARVIEPDDLSWESLVLPERETRTLKTMEQQIRHRHRVYRQWGFARSGAGALGISGLFSGTSGTGKTLAARVIGSVLQLDVYHIDLSSIVSKYIGETEKNLERVFQAAESSGAILFFDEADALFGKRSQVRDSHDRYANMSVSYLLQRMESFMGLSILATNLKSAMDDGFARRLRFIVQFPFPGPAEREAIWRGVFPAETPTRDLQYDKLAGIEVPGGVIRNIALGAAFHAAADGGTVAMQHLRDAASDEFIKLERTLPQELVADW